MRPSDAQTDIGDWFRNRRHGASPAATTDVDSERRKPHLLFVPIVASKPSTGLTFGGGASVEFPLGDPGDTYVSSILGGLSTSTKKFYSLSARLSVFGRSNRWAAAGDNHYQSTGQDTFGFGTDTTADDRVAARFHSVKFVDSYLRAFPHNLYAGGGLQFQRQSDIRAVDEASDAWDSAAFVAYSTAFGFDLSSQTAAGVSATLRYDSRDNVSDPSRGVYADLTYRGHFHNFLGGDSTWQRLVVDARTYRRLDAGGRHTIALWGYADAVTAGRAPYLALPATGTDAQGRSGRGYAEGRFRGDRLVYGEVEYRAWLRRDGLVGMVAFLNATTVGSTFDGDRLFDEVAPAAGVGLRLRLDKRSRTNIGLDFGFGRNGSHGIYIALAEAF